jgi:hypothetical protein
MDGNSFQRAGMLEMVESIATGGSGNRTPSFMGFVVEHFGGELPICGPE